MPQADKVGADGFSADDEQVLSVLGAQVGRIYENGKLYPPRNESSGHAPAGRNGQSCERAMLDLRASEERFRQLAENIQDVFFIQTAPITRRRCM